MKICFPVAEAQGISSEVFGHFGSAPAFIIVETESNHVATINNKDQHHAHGACKPIKALDNQRYFRQDTIQKNKQRISQWLQEQGIETEGDFILAGYNPPWVPWFLARNEALIQIKIEPQEKN